MPKPVYRKNPKLPPLSVTKGRPCLLTKECEKAILSAIEKGMPLKEAAMLAGISYDTLNRWKKQGEQEDAPEQFRHLCKALDRAKAVGMLHHLSIIHNAAEKDWKASCWLLERRHSKEFGKSTSEDDKKAAQNQIQPIHLDHEVLARIKKQNGIVGIAVKVAENLALIRERNARAEAIATGTNLRGD